MQMKYLPPPLSLSLSLSLPLSLSLTHTHTHTHTFIGMCIHASLHTGQTRIVLWENHTQEEGENLCFKIVSLLIKKEEEDNGVLLSNQQFHIGQYVHLDAHPLNVHDTYMQGSKHTQVFCSYVCG
jgi:hypothetical protein